MRGSNWIDWKREAEIQRDKAERAAEAFHHYKHLAGKSEERIRQLEAELEVLRRKCEITRQNGGSEISPKSFRTLLRLVDGMAIAIYSYNPAEPRSDVVRQIQSDLDLKGISLDADTIRKWIREGVKVAGAAQSIDAFPLQSGH